MVKNKKNNKDNKTLGVVLISVLVLIAIIVCLFVFLEKRDIDVVSKDNSTRLDLSAEIDYLKMCLVSDATGDNPGCPEVRQEDIDKFAMIDGSKGIEVCNSFAKIDNGDTYQECFSFLRNCNQLFQFIDDGGDKDKKFYQVYECGSEHYYIYSHILPPEIQVVKIELSENVITGLAILTE